MVFKRISYLLLASIIIIFAASASFIYIVMDGSQPPSMVHASWIELEGGDSEEAVIENSTFIAKGIVEESSTELKGPEGGELVFTNNKVRVLELYAVNEDEVSDVQEDLQGEELIIDVQQTGGTYGEFFTPEFTEAPLFEVGSEYLLFLTKTEDGYYIPVGGRLGYAEIVDGTIVFVNDEAEELLDDFSNEDVTDAIDIIEYVDESIPESGLSINEDNLDIEEMIEESAGEVNE
ncbi:MAG: hypothetical protein LBN34_02415 [Clostridiales Family XIII bacterium]|jgi:hypothetical protein|nr:hypothetical protein [Clostridiales Family XIII bacterium]